MQEGTGERRDCSAKGVPICHIRKIAQLQLQRMQVLRCQEFEPSFFAERQGLEVQTDRPRSKLIHKQIDRQPSTAFARTIFKYWLPLHPAPHRRTPLAPWRAYPRRPLPRLCTHTHEAHLKDRNAEWEGTGGGTDRCHARRCPCAVRILQEGTGERRDRSKVSRLSQILQDHAPSRRGPCAWMSVDHTRLSLL